MFLDILLNIPILRDTFQSKAKTVNIAGIIKALKVIKIDKDYAP
jgi:hypothetical protein